MVALPAAVTTQQVADALTRVGLQVERIAVSYTHLRAHETVLDLVCRLLLEKKKNNKSRHISRHTLAQTYNNRVHWRVQREPIHTELRLN